mmetsp:Transcript_11667/g.31857  ORF Transcript_11667/g.31857 Transcript_11667/m.31857 type:complete len:250 (-) Transcript_11667:50-799(-)|eukprot:CAMPEP_0171213322 /NCGR_PEP_ID=MMETSP0790-20130122/30584_1 /TAXON_ID=2925 /ORGANISM="Alexandrium catenella, Strain OF101" /LENGTH=249 /DNA_ID=CAMNT_0011679025 /DNA_START=65 /DNA_END=814 /DNA_ORIENTATION=+
MRVTGSLLASLVVAAVRGSRTPSQLLGREGLASALETERALSFLRETPEVCAGILLAIGEAKGEAMENAMKAALASMYLVNDTGKASVAGGVIGVCGLDKIAVKVGAELVDVAGAPGAKTKVTFGVEGQKFGISYDERGQPQRDDVKAAVDGIERAVEVAGMGVLSLVYGAFASADDRDTAAGFHAAGQMAMSLANAYVLTPTLKVGIALTKVGLASKSAIEMANYFAEHCSGNLHKLPCQPEEPKVDM